MYRSSYFVKKNHGLDLVIFGVKIGILDFSKAFDVVLQSETNEQTWSLWHQWQYTHMDWLFPWRTFPEGSSRWTWIQTSPGCILSTSGYCTWIPSFSLIHQRHAIWGHPRNWNPSLRGWLSNLSPYPQPKWPTHTTARYRSAHGLGRSLGHALQCWPGIRGPSLGSLPAQRYWLHREDITTGSTLSEVPILVHHQCRKSL